MWLQGKADKLPHLCKPARDSPCLGSHARLELTIPRIFQNHRFVFSAPVLLKRGAFRVDTVGPPARSHPWLRASLSPIFPAAWGRLSPGGGRRVESLVPLQPVSARPVDPGTPWPPGSQSRLPRLTPGRLICLQIAAGCPASRKGRTPGSGVAGLGYTLLRIHRRAERYARSGRRGSASARSRQRTIPRRPTFLMIWTICGRS